MKTTPPALVIAIVALIAIAAAFSIATIAYTYPTFAHTNGVLSDQNPTLVHANPFIAVPVGISAYIGTGTAGRDPESNAPRDDRCGIALFDRLSDNAPKPISLRWDELVDLLRRHDIRQDKDGRLFSPTQYAVGARRGNEGVLALTAFVGDIDDGWPLSSAESVLRRGGWAFVIYTTHSHTAVRPKFRIVVPFAAPVATVEWEGVWAQLNELFGGHLDPGTKDPARISFLPSHPPGAPSEVRVGDGRSLDVTTLPPLIDIEEVCRKLEALPLGPEAAEIARRLYDGRVTTDGWPGDANDWLVQMLVDAGLTPREVERFHRHKEVVRHTSDWADRAKRVSRKGADGKPKKTFHLKRTTLERSPFFRGIAEEVRNRRSTGAPRKTDRPGALTEAGEVDLQWVGKTGWEDEPELEIKKEKKTVGHGKDKTEVDVLVEPAYVVYNALVSRHGFRPFRTLSGEARVAIPTAHGVEVHDPSSTTFVDWVGFRYYALAGDRIPDRDLARAAKVMAGRATAPELPRTRVVDLSIRVAPVGRYETILDLGDSERRCVRIRADGWSVERAAKPVFERPSHMLPLPEPERAPGSDGDWTRANGLFRFVSLGLPDPEESGGADEKVARALRLEGQKLLVLAEVVHAILSPRSPKVIPILNGDDGSGKSHAAAKLGAVTDPSIVQHVPIPETEQDLLALALNRATISLDNVSHIDLWLSDALARLCTGTGLAKRRLYTDRDEVVSRLIPRIILNGITAVPKNPDLIRRVLFLWAVKPDQTLGDEEYDAAWEEAHPAILGGFLDLACRAARVLRDSPPAGNGDSMADFARIGRAVALATGNGVEDFDTAWSENQSRQLAAAEENPWVGALHEVFAELKPGETITPEAIARRVSADHRESFPKGVTSQEVGNAIARVRRTLRTLGLSVERRKGTGGTRLYFHRNPESGATGATQTRLPSEKDSGTPVAPPVAPPTLGAPAGVAPPDEVPLGGHPSSDGHSPSENGPEVAPVTPVAPPLKSPEEPGGAPAEATDVGPDPGDLFAGGETCADRVRRQLGEGES